MTVHSKNLDGYAGADTPRNQRIFELKEDISVIEYYLNQSSSSDVKIGLNKLKYALIVAVHRLERGKQA